MSNEKPTEKRIYLRTIISSHLGLYKSADINNYTVRHYLISKKKEIIFPFLSFNNVNICLYYKIIVT